MDPTIINEQITLLENYVLIPSNLTFDSGT